MRNRPSKKEIRKYFENVQTIAPCFGVYKRDFYTPTLKRTHFDPQSEALYCDCEEPDTYCCLWSKESGYAKILSYKTPQYKITKEQILNLNKYGNIFTSNSLKDMFPEAFKTELEVGKWYKTPYCGGALFCVTDLDNIKNGHISGYGTEVRYGWQGLKKDYWYLDKGYTEATPEEVKEALIAEAKKRGYKDRNYKCLVIPECTNKVKDNFHYNRKYNQLFHGESENTANNVVFSEGKWATIIETISREEAEKLLNKKII